jgi:elongation factor Ts
VVSNAVFRRSLQTNRCNFVSQYNFKVLLHQPVHVSNNYTLMSLTRNFSALSMDMLKELRTISGAPIVECKKALQSSDNDLNAAIDWLREHGAAKATSKVQGRESTEGLVAIYISSDGKSGSIVRVSSETDFAGRSDKFVSFVTDVATATATTTNNNNTTTMIGGQQLLDSDTILSAQANGRCVKDLLDDVIVAIRENISVAEAIQLNSGNNSNSIFVGYVHNKIQSTVDAGTAAAVVELVPMNDSISIETIHSVGKKLAMHVVAAKPLYNTISEVPADEVQKETDLLSKQLTSDPANETKPTNVIEKIVQGRLRKYYEMICLSEQGHMLEEKNPKVRDVLKSVGIEIKSFKLLSIN